MYSITDFRKDLASGKFRTMSEEWTARQKIGAVTIELDAQDFLSRTHGGPTFELGDALWRCCLIRAGGAPGLRRLRSDPRQVWMDGRVHVVQGSISVTPGGALDCTQDLRLQIDNVPERLARNLRLRIVDE